MSSSNMCATKANKQSLGFLRGILHTMSHVSTDWTGSRHAEAVDVFQAAPHNFVTKRCLSAFNSYEFQAKS